jgi:hypothetical protein
MAEKELTAAKPTEQPPTDSALEVYREILVLTITDQDSLGKMADLVKKLKTGIKNIETWFEPMKASAAAAHKAICNRENETLAPFKEGATTGQTAINAFLTEERRLAAIKQRELEEAAAAEKKRQEDELKESAKVLEDLGQTTAAQALREDAERVVAAPVFVPTVDKTVRTGGGSAGGGTTLSAKTKIEAQVTDVKAFLKYLVEQDSAATFVEFPKAKLDAWVKANGIKAGQVPGLAVNETIQSAIR